MGPQCMGYASARKYVYKISACFMLSFDLERSRQTPSVGISRRRNVPRTDTGRTAEKKRSKYVLLGNLASVHGIRVYT